jgi:hypothetical protein
MRKFYCGQVNEKYIPITDDALDCRSASITAYLDLLDRIVKGQLEKLRNGLFEDGSDSDIVKYFELLPSTSSLRILFDCMNRTEEGEEKIALQEALRI